MHFPDGGFRPADNEQVVVETSHALIIRVEASTNGSDQNQTLPALENGEHVAPACQADLPKTGLTRPRGHPGFVTTEAVDATAAKGITLIGPVPAGPSAPMDANNPTAREWRERMVTPEMNERDTTRAGTVALGNAWDRCWFGLSRIPVRGLAKVRAFLTLAASADDIRVGLIPALFPQIRLPVGASEMTTSLPVPPPHGAARSRRLWTGLFLPRNAAAKPSPARCVDRPASLRRCGEEDQSIVLSLSGPHCLARFQLTPNRRAARRIVSALTRSPVIPGATLTSAAGSSVQRLVGKPKLRGLWCKRACNGSAATPSSLVAGRCGRRRFRRVRSGG